MASNAQIKGITIKIEGDTSPLAKDLQSINKDISQTSKALKDVEAALKLDPSNVELLAQKQELLNKQIEQTNTKLELEKQAGEDAKHALEIGDISAEEYATLQAEIVKTEDSLNKLEGQANSSSDELKQTGEAAKQAGEDAKSSGVNWQEMANVIGGAAEAAVVAIGAVTAAVGAAAAALADASLEAANYADDVLTLSSTSGVATDTLQALQYGEDLLDVSTSTVTSSITKLIKSMGSAQDSELAWRESMDELNAALADGEISAEDYQDAVEQLGSASAFQDLGVEIMDASGNLRDSEDVFWDVIDALGNIENETERDSAAMAILGRSARDLNPLIEAGSEGFAAIAEEAENAGAIMSDEMLEEFDGLNDTMARMQQGAQAAQRALGTVLLPVLEEIGGEGVSLINEFTNAVLDTDGDIEALGGVIDEMVPRVLELLDTYLPTLIEFGGTIIEVIATALLDNMGSIITSAGELILTIGQGIIDHLSDLAPIVADLLVQVANFIVLNLPTVLTAAVQIIVAIVQGLAQAAPELIPAIVDAVLLMCETLLGPDCLPALITAAQELLLGIIEGIILATPDILAEIPNLVASIIESFSELGPQLVDNAFQWGMDMIQGLIDGIEDMGPALASGAAGIAGTIASYLHFSVPEKGPLSDFDKSGGDMIDTFISSMEGEDPALERALYGTANIINNGMTQDYTGALNGISSQLGAISSADGGPRVINVWIGQQRLGSVVVNALDSEYYLAGGT
ncbi:hypothetical protein [Ruminococcus sp.]|uniref:phage tail protein n=1 Tax=Ruminococcus sp. TaxID=41978 RepID=UPI00386D6DE9